MKKKKTLAKEKKVMKKKPKQAKRVAAPKPKRREKQSTVGRSPRQSKTLTPSRGSLPTVYGNGYDEMNLTDFPFASLRTKGDSRKAITYEHEFTDKDGNRRLQRWKVTGNSELGLPTEVDERVYVALMYLTGQQGFEDRKVPFSVYRVLKIMGLKRSKVTYQEVEKSLERLRGVSIKADGSFWDNEKKELERVVSGFGLIDNYWLRYKEKDQRVIEAEGVPAYIRWNEVIWKSIATKYFKPLDVNYFYSLDDPTCRRLFRLLDKKFYKDDDYEFDIFDLAQRLGMAHYRYPSEIWKQLKPHTDHLTTRGFLKSAEPFLHQGYKRIRFTKGGSTPPPAKSLPEALPQKTNGAKKLEHPQKEKEAPSFALQMTALQKKYGTSEKEIGIWEEVLKKIKEKTNEVSYGAWFKPTCLLSLKNGIAIIGVPYPVHKEHLSKGRAFELLEQCLRDLNHTINHLEFVIP